MEQRLIDANAFKKYLKEKFKEVKDQFQTEKMRSLAKTITNDFCRDIDEQLTVDAVQIVRCKDCLHHTDVEPYDHECELIPSNAVFCQHFAVVRDKDWFCADGERRKD